MLARILLLVLFSTTIQAAHPKPYALIDDATALLESTRDMIVRAINRAHTRIEDYFSTFQIKVNAIETEATVILKYEEQRYFGQITALEEIAESAGVDISRCLIYTADEVQNLTNVLTKAVEECISTEAGEASEILSEYKYIIDISINRLLSVEFQLRLSEPDSEECIMPLYAIIESERQYRTESIEGSILGANHMFNMITNIVQECHSLHVSEQNNYLLSFLQQVTTCPDLIIG